MMKKTRGTMFPITLRRLLPIAAVFLFAAAVLIAPASAEDVQITVESFSTGNLGNAIDDMRGAVERNDITHLIVSGGVLNADDWDTMQQMTGLVSVDLSGSTSENAEIPKEAFNNYNDNDANNGPKINLVNFVFPQGITTIQNGAFAHCYNLEFSGDWLPDTVTVLNPLAFQDCKKITSVDLSGLEILGRQAFQRTGLTGTITLPDNLILKSNKVVDNFYIFDGCSGITKIVMGKNIRSMGTDKDKPFSYIGGSLFSGTSVTEFVVPGDIEYLGSIGTFAGSGCEITISDGVKYLGLYYKDGGTTPTNAGVAGNLVGELVIPDSVIEIGSISDENSITKLEYHGSATGIGKTTLINRLYTKSTVQEVDLRGSGTTEFTSKVGASNTALTEIDLSDCASLTTVKIIQWRNGGVLNLLGCTALESMNFGSNNDGSASSGFILLVDDSTVLSKETVKAGTHVTLIANGGNFEANADFSDNKLPSPTKTGYTAKWYEYVEGKTDYSDVQDVTTAENDKTYIAIWTLATPTIEATPSSTVTWGEKVTLTADHGLGNGVSYQWYNNTLGTEIKILDATSPTYEVTSDTPATFIYYCNVTAENGEVAMSDEVTVTWEKKAGSITIANSKTTATYGDEPFTFTYTASGDVTVANSNENVATVSDNAGTVTVTIVGIGSTDISVNFAGNENYIAASDSFTLTVSADDGAMTITPDASSLVGGGKVNLTVKGVPEGESFSVTCDDADVAAKLVQNADGTYTAELPNADKTYKFTAKYTGTANYQIPDAYCPVKVTAVKVVGEVIGLPADKDLGLGSVDNEDKETLTAAIGGEHKSAFAGKGTPVFVEVSVLKADGKPDHDVKITFTLAYSTLGITADKAGTYDFVVLHLMENGKTVIVPAVATADGLKIGPTTTSPFAIAYSVKKDDTNTGGSSTSQGSSVWLTETQAPTPTETAQPTPSDTVPTTQPTPTETQSPLSVLVVLGGLGAVAVLRRK